MQDDAVASRASLSQQTMQGGKAFFAAEPPLPLADINALRAADPLIAAFYRLGMSRLSTDTTETRGESGEAQGFPLLKVPTPDATSSRRPSGSASGDPARTGAAERRRQMTQGRSEHVVVDAAQERSCIELFCSTFVRELLDVSAERYASRCLDRMAEAYTVYSIWDDVRDTVAHSFLPQDNEMPLATLPAKRSVFTDLNAIMGCWQPSFTSDGVPPCPLFAMTAMARAEAPVRRPTVVEAPSAVSHSPVASPRAVSASAALYRRPVVPAGIPIDAYSRYVIESELRRRMMSQPAPNRSPSSQRDEKRMTRTSLRESVASKQLGSKPVTSGPPAPSSASSFHRGMSLQQRKSTLLGSRKPSRSKGNTNSTAFQQDAATTSANDALTTAMGQAPLSYGGVTPSRGREMSNVHWPSVDGDLPSWRRGYGTGGAGGTAAPSKDSGTVIIVEKDQLTPMPRIPTLPLHGSGRKPNVVYHLTPGSDDRRGSVLQRSAEVRTVASSSEEPVVSTPAAASTAKMAEPSVAEPRFFIPTDCSNENSLQEQIDVVPAPGVTVLTADPTRSGGASQRLRKNAQKKGADETILSYGGEFNIPADKVELSTMNEVRNSVAAGAARGAPNASSARHPQSGQRFNTGKNKSRPGEAMRAQRQQSVLR